MDDFLIDPKNKLGADSIWEEDDEFSAFADALNRGVTVSGNSIPAADGDGGEITLDANALAELRARFAAYR